MTLLRERRRRARRRDEELLEEERQAAAAAPMLDPAAGAAPTPENLLTLQRTAGNRAVSALLSGTLHQQGDAPALSLAEPGMFLGEADTLDQTPGVTAPDADAHIEDREGRAAGAATATAAPAAADGAAQADGVVPATGAGAPAAPGAFSITSRTDMHAPDRTPDDRTTVAMGEVVYLTAVGGAAVDWKATGGWPRARSARTTFAWELSDPGSATITATDPATGAAASIDITAIAPTAIRMRKELEFSLPAATAGCGMQLIPRFAPGHVNFGNVEMKEDSGPPSGVTGYFAARQALGANLNHLATTDFHRIGPLMRDTAAMQNVPPPWSPGTFQWTIPNRFRRAGTSGPGTVYVTTTQTFTMTASGRATVIKGGATVSRSP